LKLRIKKGIVRLTSLDQKDQYADIDLTVDGPVDSALKLVEGKPIEFSSRLGFTSSKARGNSSTRLRFNFILEQALTFDGVKVSAVSNLSDVSAPDVFLSQKITDGLFHLKLDQAGLHATGTANVGQVPATISLRRNLKSDKPYRLRYNIRSRIEDAERFLKEKFGLTFDDSDYVRGPVQAEFVMDEFDDKRAKATLRLDVEPAAVSLLTFGWVKGPSIKGMIEADMLLRDQGIESIPRFRIDVADLKANGAAEFAKDGKTVRLIKIADAAFGRSKMSGQVKLTPDGWSVIDLKGPALDLSEVWSRPSAAPDPDAAVKKKETPKFHVVVDFGKVWLRKDTPILNVTGSLSRRGDTWQNAYLHGDVSKKGSIDLALYGGDKKQRSLSLLSNDAGALLRALDYYDNMIGGSFKLTGTYDDTQPNSPLNGHLRIDSYRVIKAPVLARVVSILALTGIFESLQGEGLRFSSMDVPFEERNGTITFKDGRASGPSLGFTAAGSVYTHAEVLNIEGTVVPAYLINSFFGQIPLLGDLLTGGEKGGGIFAANYKMTGPIENPKVTVNPLSALAPGIFRNLFNLFGSSATETEPPAPPGQDGS
ncbi:MAG: AsmA-like C-terminal region-containing protein, partial [Rhodospirillales bacterium]